MRPIFALALALAACKGTPTTPTDELPTGVVDEAFGYDTRPANPTCVAPPVRLVEEAEIEVNRVFGVSFQFPVALSQAPGDDDHWYVLEQGGRVKRFDATEASPTPTTVLDISALIQGGGEMGLLGFEFHPDFATNGQVMLSYTRQGPVSVLARIQTADNGATWDATSITEILTVDQPFENHNGGDLAFGTDGMLFWGLGDGGSAGDPGNRAQNLNSLLGKILRLDVDGGTPYAIPADNPFVGGTAREEIYAYGLRNPWRLSVDPATGDLWTGDVGQNAFEEVDRVQSGGNYGWRIMEGNACFQPANNCDETGLILPVVDYPQDPGFSVIGGEVYRGTAIPELVGTYLFSDYYHGGIVAITYNDDGEARRTRLADTNRSIVGFASGNDGEIYLLDHQQGHLLKIEPIAAGPVPDFPQTLSATGCVDPADPGQVVDGVIPYEVNHGFWSDGADKQRWFAIPDGQTITIGDDGDLDFPQGTVLIKSFQLGDTPIETRLFMNHQDGWAGYTYRWRADGSDADLLRAGEVVDIEGQAWEIPSRPGCMQCHTVVAGRALGLEVGQLDRTAIYPATSRRAPQLDTLANIGLITAPEAPTPFPALTDEAIGVEERARTYLHVNCSMCHQPDGPGRGELDLRLSTPLAETGLCGEPEHGDLGLVDARVVAAGAPERSVVLARLRDGGVNRMPPIGSRLIDDAGIDVISSWITGLTACP